MFGSIRGMQIGGLVRSAPILPYAVASWDESNNVNIDPSCHRDDKKNQGRLEVKNTNQEGQQKKADQKQSASMFGITT